MSGHVRCKAKARTGNRCKKPPIAGGTVCRLHGGGAPQVKQAARERLAALVLPAITRIGQLIRTGRPDHVRLAASRDALDRAGLKPASQLQLSGRVRLDGLKGRLARMGIARGSRLLDLLQRDDLVDDERQELAVLRRAAGFDDEDEEE